MQTIILTNESAYPLPNDIHELTVLTLDDNSGLKGASREQDYSLLEDYSHNPACMRTELTHMEVPPSLPPSPPVALHIHNRPCFEDVLLDDVPPSAILLRPQ